MLCKEPELPYDRVALSHLLAGERTRDDLQLRPAEWYADRKVDVRFGGRATSCASTRATCVLSDCSVLGLRPGRALHGLGSAHAAARGERPAGRDRVPRPRRTATRSPNAARSARHAVVIGGGLLGLEAARGIAGLGCRDDRRPPGGQAHGAPARSRAPRHCFSRRCPSSASRCGSRRPPRRSLGEHAVEGLRFADGEELEADLVVISVGITPQVDLARESGL